MGPSSAAQPASGFLVTVMKSAIRNTWATPPMVNNARATGFSAAAMDSLTDYRWPGNVRELQNILEQVVLLSDDDIVEPSSLPEEFLKKTAGPADARRQTLEALAQQLVECEDYSAANPLMPQIEAVLATKMVGHADNKNQAASLLGITKPTLYNRLRNYERLSLPHTLAKRTE